MVDELPVCTQYLQQYSETGKKYLPEPEFVKCDQEYFLIPDHVIMSELKSIPVLLNLASIRDSHSNLCNKCIDSFVSVHVIPSNFEQTCSKKQLMINKQRTADRLIFLKWANYAFKNIHFYYPDSSYPQAAYIQSLGAHLGTNHIIISSETTTTGFNGLGILTLTTSVPKCEGLVFGKPIHGVYNPVVGVNVVGAVSKFVVSTDIVLHMMKLLKDSDVNNRCVEVFGESMDQIAISDRITISSMVKECGAEFIFFPCDSLCEKFLRAIPSLPNQGVRMNKAQLDMTQTRQYDRVITFDLSTVQTSISGPKRSSDRILLSNLPTEFKECLYRKISPTSYGLEKSPDSEIRHGGIVGVSLAGCTNSSNALVTLVAAIIAKRLADRGITIPKHVSARFHSGGGLASLYLEKLNLQSALSNIGFTTSESCCQTLPVENVAESKSNLVTCALLSGNGNYECRKFAGAKANYLMSSPLAILLSVAGYIDSSLDNMRDIEDIWPDRGYLVELESSEVLPGVCHEVYSNLLKFNPDFTALPLRNTSTYCWDELSLYLRRPPYIDMLPVVGNIRECSVLLCLGDNVSSEHISPAGSMNRASDSALYLSSNGVQPKDYDSYGNRRGNHNIVSMGVFNHMKLQNKLVPNKKGPYTLHLPSHTVLSVYQASSKYRDTATPLAVIAGSDYGEGVTRDMGARGLRLLGVVTVIATSFDDGHRQELIHAGVVPVKCPEALSIDPTVPISVAWVSALFPGCKGVLTSGSTAHAVSLDVRQWLELEVLTNGGVVRNRAVKLQPVQPMYF